jgi:hypothetical protein
MMPHSDAPRTMTPDPAMQAIVRSCVVLENSATHAAVRDYLQRGWIVLPVEHGTRETRERDWTHPTKRWSLDRFAPNDNVALRLDAFTDIEPDTSLARQVCKFVLPSTACYGRPSGGVPTHYLYDLAGNAEALQTLKTYRLDGKELIGIRSGSGEYSLVPPSFYRAEPERGKPADTLEWMSSVRTPLRIDVDDLLPHARVAATVAALAQKWVGAGGRHNMAGYVAGLLCRLLPKDDAQWEWFIVESERGLTKWESAVVSIVRHAAKLAGDDEVADREAYARKTVARFRDRVPLKGGPSLRELVDGDLVSQLYRWWDDSGEVQRVDEMNGKHAVLFGQHGKVVVLTEETEDDQVQIRFSDPGTMSLLYPQPVRVGKKSMPLGDWWIRHAHRRFYRGIELAPNGHGNPGYYNLWRGFAVEPKRGDWSLFREHLQLVAGDDDASAKYIEAWMAETVQHPERPIGIVPAFKGEQGTGKSTLAKWFGALFGPHFIHLDSENRLLGQFNAHLHNKIVVLADEAVWAGGKVGLGALKRLITEDTLNIEKKHVDVIQVKNLIHMMVASNEDWVVPVGFDNRRFAVFCASTRRQNDRAFFAAVEKQLFRDGGLAALLYDLLEFQSDIDLWKIPETQALTEQKILSAKPVHKWWIEKLHSGDLGVEERWADGKEHRVEKFIWQSDYVQFVNTYTTNRWEPKQTQTQLGMFLSKETPVIVDKHVNYYRVPSLDACRSDWVRRHRWPKDYDWGGSAGSEGSGLF